MLETANPVIAQIETMPPIWLLEIKTLAMLNRLDIVASLRQYAALLTPRV